ncbi:MAG: DMT family transporter [Pseudomonadota bacterium]
MAFSDRLTELPNQGSGFALALVMAAACLFGLNPIFAKLAFEGGLDPIGALVWRFGLPCLLLAPFWLKPRPTVPQTPMRRPIVIALGAGVIMGLGMLAYFAALETLTVGTAAVIYFTYPAFTILIGLIVFKESPTRQALAACALVIVASALVIGAPTVGPDDLSAVALCFAAPVAFAILLQALGRGLGAMTPLSRAGVLVLGHLIVLIPFLMLQTEIQALPTSTRGWVGAVGLAFAASLLPQLLMATGAPKIGATRTSLLGSFELITALVLGWVLLGESVSTWTLAGSALVVAALYLTVRGSPPER